jgi:DNA excision repair protein ERCC-2
VQLELAGRADAIVADYNYVFEPGVALRRLEPEDEPVLLVDEAHNLPDRARRIFSPELLEEAFRAAQDSLLLQSGELFDSPFPHPRRTHRAAGRNRRRHGPGQGRMHSKQIRRPNRCAPLWMEWEPAFIRYLSRGSGRRRWRGRMIKIVDIHFAWQRFMAVLNLFGPGFTCVVENRAAGARLAIVCLDPARPLATGLSTPPPRPRCSRPRFRRWR